MATLDQLAAFIAAQGGGTVKTGAAQTATPWLIYTGVMPPGDREDAISLTMYSGGAPLEVMGSGATGVVAEQPRIQIVARHSSYATALAKAETLWTILHNHSGTLSGVRYLRIECQTQPYPIGRDTENRFLMGFSIVAWKERG